MGRSMSKQDASQHDCLYGRLWVESTLNILTVDIAYIDDDMGLASSADTFLLHDSGVLHT